MEKLKWISIKDKLPKEQEDVLVSTKYGHVTRGYYKNDFNSEWCVNRDFYLKLDDILAWMPLPKPYQAGDGE